MPRTTVWRIARRPFALDRTGDGARRNGGRWNHVGTSVVYAGSTIAIAALERLVHLAGIIPPHLFLVRITLPAGFSEERPRLAALPPGWAAVSPAPASADFGTSWAVEKRSLVLWVPSALVPEETNVVINPAHVEMAGVRMSVERPFSYDDRFFAPGPARRRRGSRPTENKPRR